MPHNKLAPDLCIPFIQIIEGTPFAQARTIEIQAK